jgi:hypothetical protein
MGGQVVGYLGTPDERFDKRVGNPNGDGCTEWLGGKYRGGYGQFRWNGRSGRAHRFAYERVHGPIPEGLQLDHLCRNPSCVNPAHLEPVTNRENCLRGFGPSGVAAFAEVCRQGHPYDSENTYVHPKTGHRQCRACKRLAAQDRYYRMKELNGGKAPW